MSRHSMTKGPLIITWGNDHALGTFLQLQDRRFAGTPTDHQGEGYLFDYDQRFGISINLVGLTLKEVISLTGPKSLDSRVKKKIDYFIITLNNGITNK